jgi:hypothetical protein
MGCGFCQIMNGKKRAVFCKRRKGYASLASRAGPSGLTSLRVPRTAYLIPLYFNRIFIEIQYPGYCFTTKNLPETI